MPTAQSVTITEVLTPSYPIHKVTWDWLADDSGKVVDSVTTYRYTGKLLALLTIPDTSTSAPDDNYDITISDSDGFDLLAGSGANRDTANTEVVASSSMACVLNSTLTLNILTAGDANAGTAILFIENRLNQ